MSLEKYEKIIDMPHHVSKKRARMSNYDRAAQFAPFAALTGYGSKINEAARLTDTEIELDENQKAIIDEKLQIVSDNLKSEPEITITYFVPDEKKDGGAYLDITGRVKKIDENESKIIFTDGESVSIEKIINIKSKLFDE